MSYLAVDIGGTHFRSALVEGDGTIGSRLRGETRASDGAQAILADLMVMCDRLISKAKHVDGIGISFGGPVNFETQSVLRSQHVSGWDGLRLADMLSQRYEIAAVMDNDANAAALGESVYGAGKNVSNFVYLTVSTGVGGGLILNDNVVRGRNHLAAEIGHIIVEAEGRLCVCGKRGCAEAYASGSSLAAIATAAVANDADGGTRILDEADGACIDSAAVYRAARSGDPLAGELVDLSIRSLALAISNVVTLVDPDLVVIGGGVTAEGRFLFDPLARYVSEFSMFGESYPVPVVPAELGDDAGLIGASVLVG